MNRYLIWNHIKATKWLVYTRLLSQCQHTGRTACLKGPLSVLLCLPRTFATSNYSPLSRNELHFRTTYHVNEGMRIRRYLNAFPYSTVAYEDLSVNNDKVQMYLKKLKNQYENALNNMDGANMETVNTLRPAMDLLEEIETIQSDVSELHTLASNSSDKEMEEMAQLDLEEAQAKLKDLEEELFGCLIPKESVDSNDVIFEVSAGVGGQEAMLFCQEVFEMYQSYADYMGWESQITDCETTDIGGLRHGRVVLSGEGVYELLKYEGGIHRVQRVPKTERTGRIHTSTVSVAVMPQPSEIDIQILDKDLKVETKRASGAGGQHVNTTDSAVRMTHLPTGIQAECQRERSQHRNKEECLKKLRAILYQQELDQKLDQYTSNRKLQVGTRGRSEKIRTYNYPQDRVTDHRIGVSLHNLPSFLGGTDTLHSLISQLVEEARKEILLELINSVE